MAEAPIRDILFTNYFTPAIYSGSHFEYTAPGDDTYGKPSEVSAVVSEDGSTVINIRFHRQRYWLAFNTAGLGTIYYEDGSYTRGTNDTDATKDYFIQVWLNKNIVDEWPATGRTADESNPGYYSKAALVMTGSKKYNNWTSKKAGNTGTIMATVDKDKLDKAKDVSVGGKTNVLEYTLTGTDETKEVTTHFIKDGVEDTSLRVELYKNWDSGTAYPDNSSYYYTFKSEDYSQSVRELDGYDIITSAADAYNTISGVAGYNYSVTIVTMVKLIPSLSRIPSQQRPTPIPRKTPPGSIITWATAISIR